MKRIILAPVPCRHLDSALRMQSERIAFGTDATHFFENEEIKKGICVLIYASRKSAGAAHLFVTGCATFEARFENWLRADKTGKHPVPDERAATTVSDTPFEGFWVVSSFRRLPKKQWVYFSKLNSNQSLKIFYPRGPMCVMRWRREIKTARPVQWGIGETDLIPLQSGTNLGQITGIIGEALRPATIGHGSQ